MIGQIKHLFRHNLSRRERMVLFWFASTGLALNVLAGVALLPSPMGWLHAPFALFAAGMMVLVDPWRPKEPPAQDS